MNSRQNVRGILGMLLAAALFSLMDTGLKLLSPHYPSMQVAALRAMSSLPLVIAFVAWRRGFGTLLRVRWPLHLLRGALGIGMLSLFAFALRTLPLAEAYSIFFIAPLLITLLSGPMLGERVGAARWGAIIVGLAGVVVVLRPTGTGMFTLAGGAVLLAATAYSVSAITVRIVNRTDSLESQVFWLRALVAIGAGALAAPDWVPVRIEHGWVLCGAGIIVASGIYLVRHEAVHAESEHP
jgi:drug/metabolite transporter (DMT)-like permease